MLLQICSFDLQSFFIRKLPEKLALGALALEGENSEFWVALSCLSECNALKQHSLIRGLQLDVSLAYAWAYLGKVPSTYFIFLDLDCNLKINETNFVIYL